MEKKTFVFILTRDDSSQKVVYFDIDELTAYLENEVENTDQKDLLEQGGYSISFTEMSDKELKDMGEFDAF